MASEFDLTGLISLLARSISKAHGLRTHTVVSRDLSSKAYAVLLGLDEVGSCRNSRDQTTESTFVHLLSQVAVLDLQEEQRSTFNSLTLIQVHQAYI